MKGAEGKSSYGLFGGGSAGPTPPPITWPGNPGFCGTRLGPRCRNLCMKAGSPVISIIAVIRDRSDPSEPDTKTASPFFNSLSEIAGRPANTS